MLSDENSHPMFFAKTEEIFPQILQNHENIHHIPWSNKDKKSDSPPSVCLDIVDIIYPRHNLANLSSRLLEVLILEFLILGDRSLLCFDLLSIDSLQE